MTLNPDDSMIAFLYSQGKSKDQVDFFMKFISICRRIENRDFQGAMLNDLAWELYNMAPYVWQNAPKVVRTFYDNLRDIDKMNLGGPSSRRCRGLIFIDQTPFNGFIYQFHFWDEYGGYYRRHRKIYITLRDLRQAVIDELGLNEERKQLSPDRGYYQGT
jgi:hypothetical protein